MSQLSDGREVDRNLLFGIMALQVNFIDREALVTAMQSWVLDKTKTLGQVLLEHGKLTAEQLTALDGLIVLHLKAHSDDCEQSMKALAADSEFRQTVADIPDQDVEASLLKLGLAAAPDATVDHRPMPAAESRYQRLRHHADGGLGKLYIARDIELHRDVALKEIKAEHADDAERRERFTMEAEITGGLEHPGIVPVYGLGVYSNGRPYYAMRFIRGDSMKEAIEHFHSADQAGRSAGERSLALRRLLRHFVDICYAVGYAHSRGVLHRDLKPANVMLGKFGETLVVDWGLAKPGVKEGGSKTRLDVPEEELTLRPSSGSSVDRTEEGVAVGTPAFMSPEQAAGRLMDLGPTSDIFSLGSTLYVLLTGTKPFAATDKAELLAQVRSGLFLPPKEVKPKTPWALDAICRKAMSLKPRGRYASALALAADVEHWLADEPVAAFPEPLVLRLGRWVRRHRTALVGATVLLASAVVALSISTGLIWAEQQKTVAQQRRAEQNYELARDLSFNSLDLLETFDVDFATLGLLGKRKQMLTTASQSTRKLLEQQGDDVELQKRAAKVFRYTANVHRLENETASAAALYENSIALQQDLAVRFPRDAAAKIGLVDTLRDQANLQVNVGKLREASANLARGMQIARQVLQEGKDQPSHQRLVAMVLIDAALADYWQGKIKDSQAAAEQAIGLLEALANVPEKGRPYDPLLLAMAHNQLGVAYRESGELLKARVSHAAAAKKLEPLFAKPPAQIVAADLTHTFLWCMLDQSRTLVRESDAKSIAIAHKNLGSATTRWEGLIAKQPNVHLYRWFLANTFLTRGLLYVSENRRDEASRDFDKAESLLSKLVEEFREFPFYRADLGRAHAALAGLAAAPQEKARLYRLSIQSLETAVLQSPDNVHDRQFLKEVKELAK